MKGPWVIGCFRHRKLYCEECNGALAAIQAEYDEIMARRIEATRLMIPPQMWKVKLPEDWDGK